MTTLAGFVEAGETFEACVAREVLEETGVRIDEGSVRYLKSQPWPFPQSCMVAFRATADCDQELVLDDELLEAKWWDRSAVRKACAVPGAVMSPDVAKEAFATDPSLELLVPPKKMVFRTRDPLTGETSADWRKALAIDGFPTFMGVAEQNEKADDDVLAAMRWHIIPETGVVLLNPLVPLHYIYRHQHNAVVGNVWSKHHNQFAHLVATHAPKGRILEIGGGHGYLAAKLLFSEAVQHWTMVDPNPVSTFAIPDLDIVKSYVEDLGKLPHEIDCVVHSHTLEHMYDPARFFEARALGPLLAAVGTFAVGWGALARPEFGGLAERTLEVAIVHVEHIAGKSWRRRTTRGDEACHWLERLERLESDSGGACHTTANQRP